MPTGMYQRLKAEDKDLKAEVTTIRQSAEKAGTDLTEEQRERLVAIRDRRETLKSDLELIEAEREETLAAVADVEDQPKAGPTPFRSLGEQLKAVAQAALSPHSRPDQRLIDINAATGASEIVGSDGGFLVQTDIANDLLADVFTEGVIAPLAKTREVGGGFNGIKFNVIDETSRATGSRYGGVRAYWTAEGGSKTGSRPKFRQTELTLQKLAGLYVATDELLADTVALESFVRPAFVSEFAFAVDDAMIRGTGAGMPLGILNSSAKIEVAKESGQPADTILYENLLAMLGRLSPRSVRNARWFTNQALWALFPSMSMTIGTGGVPVWLPPTGVAGAPFGSILGIPVEVIEHASAPGDVGDIILADWSEYLLIRKGGIESASSIHVYFDTDETAFRWVLRINGRPLRETALTPYKGSATTSPFVTLAAR